MQPENDRDFRRNGIGKGHAHGEGIDPFIGGDFSCVVKFKRFFHAADGGADADADRPAVFLLQIDALIARGHHG